MKQPAHSGDRSERVSPLAIAFVLPFFLVWQALRIVLHALVQVIRLVVGWITVAWRALRAFVAQMLRAVARLIALLLITFWRPIRTVLAAGIRVARNLWREVIRPVADALKWVWVHVLQPTLEGLHAVATATLRLIEPALAVVTRGIRALMRRLRAAVSAVGRWMYQIVRPAWRALAAAASKAWRTLGAAFGFLWSAAEVLVSWLAWALGEVGRLIWPVLKPAVLALADAMTVVFRGMASAWMSARGALSGASQRIQRTLQARFGWQPLPSRSQARLALRPTVAGSRLGDAGPCASEAKGMLDDGALAIALRSGIDGSRRRSFELFPARSRAFGIYLNVERAEGGTSIPVAKITYGSAKRRRTLRESGWAVEAGKDTDTRYYVQRFPANRPLPLDSFVADLRGAYERDGLEGAPRGSLAAGPLLGICGISRAFMALRAPDLLIADG